jgi:LacI family transcriptional regulator
MDMEKRNGVGIAHIARAAGVSITTVSRILNGDETLRIHSETRARVLDAAQSLGYQPNLFAAALRTNRTGIIGALSPNPAGTFLPMITMMLERAARARDVELLIGVPQVEPARIEAQINKLQGLLFDGLLLLGDVLDYQATIRRLNVLSKPYVSVCAGDDVPAPLVKADEAESMRLAITYLRDLGHTRIGYLGSIHWQQEQYRLSYFQAEMQRQSLPIDPQHCVLMDSVVYQPLALDFQQMWTVAPLRAAQQMLGLPDPPTALVCANDGFALAAMKGALMLGWRVPEDISIIGHNDEIPSALFFPELTTIRQPVEQIADTALSLLLRMIEGDPDVQPAQERILLPGTLIMRGSCAPPAAHPRP